MFNNFRENARPSDVFSNEIGFSECADKCKMPTLNELKSKMERFFGRNDNAIIIEIGSKMTGENPCVEYNAGSVILDDGTVVNIPKEMHCDDLQQENASYISRNDVKPTRELTEDEKSMLCEKLQWTDKQLAKCTIDEDNVIHYKTHREDLEGEIGKNGIPYVRKTVDIHGIKVQGVFPVFESACDVKLPETLEKASNACQFKECNEQLKERVESDSSLRYAFDNDQLEDIENGDTPSGCVWHHNEEQGKMQLVKIEDHDRTQGGAAHTGGKALWGGSYSSHEVSNSEVE